MPKCLTPDRPLGVPKTWEVQCVSCEEPKWPLQVTAPEEPYMCQLCLLAGPEKIAARQQAARLRASARRLQE